MKAGQLVPDDVVIGMILERIAKPDCANGFMLDGFPRTRPQAEALDAAMTKAGVALDAVVLIEVPDELIVERVDRPPQRSGDRHDLPPQVQPAAGRARASSSARTTPSRPCTTRLAKYHSETAPIMPFYDRRGS